MSQIYKWSYKYRINQGQENYGTVLSDEPVFPIEKVITTLNEQYRITDLDILDIKREEPRVEGNTN